MGGWGGVGGTHPKEKPGDEKDITSGDNPFDWKMLSILFLT